MPESVIVDDGGSTRIRWAKAGLVGEMNDLPDLISLGGRRKGSKHELNTDFTQVQISYLDENGTPGELPAQQFDKVLITSLQDQNVLLERMGNGKLKITLYSDVSEPQVEWRQSGGKRYYVVLNSGAISTVAVNGAVVYNSGSGAVPTKPTFNGPALSTRVIALAP